MRAHKTEMADAIALKIGHEIAKHNSSRLKHLGYKSTNNELWDAVRHITGKSKQNPPKCYDKVNCNILNNHYANISTDPLYTRPNGKCTVSPNIPPLSEFQVFNTLDTLHHTAEGIDKLPAWFLRLGAPIFSKVLTFLFSISLSQSNVPTQWKTAIIHPIAKIPNPIQPPDFRPISIVPILSRILEKIVVRNHLYPVLQNPVSSHLFNDQFAFRPSGSTTAALISILQHITSLLSGGHPHVILISLDFSKAFDSVRHSSLLNKMSSLPVPDYIYNWISSYLDSRSHCTLFQNSISPLTQ